VAPDALESLRVGTRADPVPDESDAQAMAHGTRPVLIANVKLCVDAAGEPSSVTMLRSSGFLDYDAKLRAAVRTWRYRPFVVDGNARPVCTDVAFRYQVPNYDPPLQDCKYDAVFAGHQLWTGPTGTGVDVSALGGERAEVSLLMPGGRAPVEGEPVAIRFNRPTAYEITLWARPGDLAPVLREPVVLAKTPEGAGVQLGSHDPGIRVVRGAAVQVVQRRGDAAQIQILDDDQHTTGWVPASVVATLYPHVTTRLVGDDHEVHVAANTGLLDKPRGAVLRQLRAKLGEQTVTAFELERREGHVLVMVADQSWWALGWVPTQRLKPAGHQARGRDVVQPVKIERAEPGGSRQDEEGSLMEVPEGALLLDRPGGTAFGRVKKRMPEIVDEVASGHAKLRIYDGPFVVSAWVVRTPPAAPP
jgi:TonB family protein